MSILVCGINHAATPIALREQVFFSSEAIPAALRAIQHTTAANEALILSTCNRTELYTDGACAKDLIRWLAIHHQLDEVTLTEHIYIHKDNEAIAHLMRVSSGLNSMVLGEPQILGQVKSAFNLAKDSGFIGPMLGRLFPAAFSTAKQVRSQTTIGQRPVSMAYAIAHLSQQLFSEPTQCRTLIIGAGEMAGAIALHLKGQGINNFIIANRDPQRAYPLIERVGGSYLPIRELPNQLSQVDIVISAIHTTLPLLGKGLVERALKARKHRIMLMVDLGLPRNIEPEIKDLEDIYLYNIDDLQRSIEQNRDQRLTAAKEAELIIAQETEAFIGQLRRLDANDLICAYRSKMGQHKITLLQEAKRALHKGKDPHQVLEQLSEQLTNTLLHLPTLQIRDAAYHGQHELLQQLRHYLLLENNQ